MHLADGILTNTPLLVSFDAAGAVGVGVALRAAVGQDRHRVAWAGTLAAFVLAAQTLNVPLVPGASAHIIGAALLTLAVGPSLAITAMTSVLIVQALVLGDGGITVLGINALDMAVLPALVVHGCRLLLGESRRGLIGAALVGTLLATAGGAVILATALVFGAGAPPALTYGWIVGVQSLAGAAEAVLTALAVRHLLGKAPALLERAPAGAGAPPALDESAEEDRHLPGYRGLRWVAVAIGLALLLLPLSSHTPDALQALVARLHQSIQ